MIRKSLADAKAKPFKFSAEQRSRIAETAELPSEDASALSDEQLARMVVARSVRRVRERTGLSQAKFAERFHFSPVPMRMPGRISLGRTWPGGWIFSVSI
ncbi:hypothetical protein AB0L20_32085, partial [Streptomyces albidoflavus]